MRIDRWLLALLGLALWQVSCQSPVADQAPTIAVEYDTLRRSTKVPLVATRDNSPYEDIILTLVYPVGCSDTGRLEGLQQWVYGAYVSPGVSTAEEAVEAIISRETENYCNKFKEAFLAGEFDDDYVDGRPPEDIMPGLVMANSFPEVNARYACMETNVRSFTGALRIDRAIECSVLNMSTMQPVHEATLFRPGYEYPLQQLIKQHLLEMAKTWHAQQAEQEEEEWTPQQYFHDFENIIPNDNFTLCDSGVTYVYWPFAITGYQEDEVRVFLPLSELAPLLDTGSFRQLYGAQQALPPSPSALQLPVLTGGEGVEYEDALRRVVVTPVRADGTVEVKVQPKLEGVLAFTVAAPGFRGVAGDLLVLGTTAEGESSPQMVYDIRYGSKVSWLSSEGKTRNFAVVDDGRGYTYAEELESGQSYLRWVAMDSNWEEVGEVPEDAHNGELKRLQRALEGGEYDGMKIAPLQSWRVDAKKRTSYENGYVWDVVQ